MLRRFHENNENKSDDRSLTSVKRNRKNIVRKKSFSTKQQAQSKSARKQFSRRKKTFRLISELNFIA